MRGSGERSLPTSCDALLVNRTPVDRSSGVRRPVEVWQVSGYQAPMVERTIRGRFPFHAGSAAPKTGDTLLTRSVQYPGGSPHQGDHGHAPSTAPGYSLGDVMHSRIGHARNRGITAVQDLSGICRAVTPL